jgi:hypothetical protein
VGDIGGERPLAGEQVVQPGGGGIEGGADRVDLRDPAPAGTDAEVTLPQSAGALLQVLEWARQPAGLPATDQPGHGHRRGGQCGHRGPDEGHLGEHVAARLGDHHRAEHLVAVRHRSGRDQHVAVVAGPDVAVQCPCQDVGVPAGGGAHQPVPIGVEHRGGEALAVLAEVGDVVGVDRGARFHVGGHGDRHVVGHPDEMAALLAQQVPQRADRQRPPEQAGGEDGGQHGHADDPSAHEASPPFRRRRPARFSAVAGMPGPGGAVTASQR